MAIHEKLMNILKNTTGIAYCIDELRRRKVSNEAEAYVLLLLLAYNHPHIISQLPSQELHDLFEKSLIPEKFVNQLHQVLEKSENAAVKVLFNLYAQYEVEQERTQAKHRSPRK